MDIRFVVNADRQSDLDEKTAKSSRPLISEAWEIPGWPTVYVLDPEGRIRYKSVGPQDAEKLDKWIDKLLKEIETKGSN